MTDQGLIYSMGSNSCGQLGIGDAPSASAHKYSPILLESLIEIEPYQIECGFNHCLLLSRDGMVYAWGDNRHGQCGVGVDFEL